MCTLSAYVKAARFVNAVGVAIAERVNKLWWQLANFHICDVSMAILE
jgi:hypothetical protein